eukprot:528882_1
MALIILNELITTFKKNIHDDNVQRYVSCFPGRIKDNLHWSMKETQHLRIISNRILQTKCNYMMDLKDKFPPKWHNIFDLHTHEQKMEWMSYYNLLELAKDNPRCSTMTTWENKPIIGPHQISKMFLNEDNDEMVIEVTCVMKVRGDTERDMVEYESFPILFPYDIKHKPLISNTKGKLLFYSNCNIIGYLGNDLIRSREDKIIDYYNKKTNTWIECAGCEERHIHTRDFGIIHLPPILLKEHNYCNLGVYYGKSVYLYHVLNKEFTTLRTIDFDNHFDVPLKRSRFSDHQLNTIQFHDRIFYVEQQMLYEILWDYTQPFVLLLQQHLPFISNIGSIHDAGKMGIAVKIGDKSQFRFGSDKETLTVSAHKKWIDENNDHLIFFDPNKDTIYRLKKDDMNIKDGVDIVDCMYDYYSNIFVIFTYKFAENYDIIILKNSIINNLEYKQLNECFDVELFQKDKSFDVYKSNNKQAFDIVLANKSEQIGFRSGMSRSKYLWYCKLKARNYWLIAGFGVIKNIYITNEMKCSYYKELENITDIAYYLGAPCWYQETCEENKHIIQTGTIIDFNKCIRSSNCVMIIRSGVKGSVNLNSITWIGIIDLQNNVNLELKQDTYVDSVSTPKSIAYKYYAKNEFKIESNCIICIDPSYWWKRGAPYFTGVKNGIWKWQALTGDCTKQLLAYHIDYENEKEYSNSWQVDEKMFDNTMNKDKDLLPMDNFEEMENKINELVVCLNDINLFNDDIIKVITIYCYDKLTKNWIKHKIIDDWYVHLYGVGVDSGYAGIFDYKLCGDIKYVADPYEDIKHGFEWFQFRERGCMPESNLWREMIQQTLKKRDPCSVHCGVVSSAGYGDGRYACLGKFDQENKQIVSVRIVFITDLNSQ